MSADMNRARSEVKVEHEIASRDPDYSSLLQRVAKDEESFVFSHRRKIKRFRKRGK